MVDSGASRVGHIRRHDIRSLVFAGLVSDTFEMVNYPHHFGGSQGSPASG
jgi:hypothetical protein